MVGTKKNPPGTHTSVVMCACVRVSPSWIRPNTKVLNRPPHTENRVYPKTFPGPFSLENNAVSPCHERTTPGTSPDGLLCWRLFLPCRCRGGRESRNQQSKKQQIASTPESIHSKQQHPHEHLIIVRRPKTTPARRRRSHSERHTRTQLGEF